MNARATGAGLTRASEATSHEVPVSVAGKEAPDHAVRQDVWMIEEERGVKIDDVADDHPLGNGLDEVSLAFYFSNILP